MQQIIKHIIEVVGMDNALEYINGLLISEQDKNRLYNQLHNGIPITTNEFQSSDFN